MQLHAQALEMETIIKWNKKINPNVLTLFKLNNTLIRSKVWLSLEVCIILNYFSNFFVNKLLNVKMDTVTNQFNGALED